MIGSEPYEKLLGDVDARLVELESDDDDQPGA